MCPGMSGQGNEEKRRMIERAIASKVAVQYVASMARESESESVASGVDGR